MKKSAEEINKISAELLTMLTQNYNERRLYVMALLTENPTNEAEIQRIYSEMKIMYDSILTFKSLIIEFYPVIKKIDRDHNDLQKELLHT